MPQKIFFILFDILDMKIFLYLYFLYQGIITKAPTNGVPETLGAQGCRQEFSYGGCPGGGLKYGI